MVGSTRQSVNKMLGLFADYGLIRVERDAIVIQDLAGLQRAARRWSAFAPRSAGPWFLTP